MTQALLMVDYLPVPFPGIGISDKIPASKDEPVI